MKVKYDNGNYVVTMTADQLQSVQCTLSVGCERLWSTASFLKALSKAGPDRKTARSEASSAKRSSDRAEAAREALEAALKKCVYSPTPTGRTK